MCERQAKKKKRGLPDRFWKLDEWKLEFCKQLRFANGLLKLFSPAAISRALKTPQGKMAYSLAAPFLAELIKHEQSVVERQEAEVAKAAPPPVATSTTEKPRESFVSKDSPLSRLRGL